MSRTIGATVACPHDQLVRERRGLLAERWLPASFETPPCLRDATSCPGMIKGNAHRLDDGQPSEVMLLEELTTFRDGQCLDPSGHLPPLTGSGLAGGRR